MPFSFPSPCDDPRAFGYRELRPDPDRFLDLWADVPAPTLAGDRVGPYRIETVRVADERSGARYETTVFHGEVPVERRTYSTNVEAREGHERAVLARRHRVFAATVRPDQA